LRQANQRTRLPQSAGRSLASRNKKTELKDAPDKQNKSSIAKGKKPIPDTGIHVYPLSDKFPDGTLRTDIVESISSKEWKKANLSKLSYFQDGIPRLYCSCGIRVMFIRYIRRSGGAAGNQELYLYMKNNGLTRNSFSLVPICWFCIHQKVTLDIVKAIVVQRRKHK
jgi:hypothetical protein